jgi:hypothetical protein
VRVTLDQRAITELADLMFANVAEQLAEDVKKWQVPSTFSPQEKAATRQVLTTISYTYQKLGLDRRIRIPKGSNSFTLMEMVRQVSRKSEHLQANRR